MSWWFSGCCLDCVMCTGMPGEWVADFGAGGWTNNVGTNCDEFAGEITLGPGVAAPNPCVTNYCWGALGKACCIWTGPIEQDGTCSGGCGDERGCETYSPILTIQKEAATTRWRYNLGIWIGCGLAGGSSRVGYRSTYATNSNCLWEIGTGSGSGTGKIVLTRWIGYHTPGNNPPDVNCAPCSGGLPATIDIWPA